MVPTLKVGDHLFVAKFFYGIPIPFTNRKILEWNSPKHGDVIVFRYPEDPSKDFIKRVIALPGQRIEIRNKEVFINGKPLKEDYKVHYSLNPSFPPEVSTRDWFKETVVPTDSYFVMGDNRDNSRDSRFWGFLPKDQIKGKALFIYWPPNRIGIIR
jgi:signal peptidase I